MGDYIDPRTSPWNNKTSGIWSWMTTTWKASSVGLVSLPNTEENWIKEYQEVTQFWRKKLGFYGPHSQLLQRLKNVYDQR